MDLLIDDMRQLPADIIIRSKRAGTSFFYVVHDALSFDNTYLDFDLGDGTGLEVLEQALFANASLGRVHVITGNPSGREQLIACLKEHHYHRDDDYAGDVYAL